MDYKRFRKIPDGLDIVNVGSGPSYYAFDWSAVPQISGYNLAVWPEDFRYDARIVKNYCDHVKRGGVVVVVVLCPLSFGENEYLYKNSFSEKYVKILPARDVDLPRIKYWTYRLVPFALPLKHFLQRVKGKLKRTFRRGKAKVPAETDAVKQMVDGWIATNRYLKDLKDAGQAQFYRKVFDGKIEDLKKVIAGCRGFGLIPVLLIPPISNIMMGYMSDEFIRAFVYDNIAKATDDDLLFLDYLRDPRFTDDSFYEPNGLFLNEAARKSFTKIVWEDVVKHMAGDK